jgi:nucleobase:cation symporter-1, NCS1 family
MAGYTVFLGPIAGIMIADYFLVRRGAVDVPALYKPKGRYRYYGGVVCLLIGTACPLEGYSHTF